MHKRAAQGTATKSMAKPASKAAKAATKAKARVPFTGARRLTPSGRSRALNQAEIAYERLKAAIVTLTIPPNTPLNEAIVCEELGLGRTPVHQACHRLALEGLVQIVPRKGILVPPLSMDDFFDLAAARRVNEAACAALAAERISDVELEELATIVTASRRMAREDLGSLITTDQRFHEIIATASRNRVFAPFLKNLNDRSARFWALSISNDAHRAEIVEEHARIVSALQRRDPDLAAATMRDHIDSFARTFSQLA
jgi:DNA-binding GntR family transcriptional regulator